MVSRLTSAHLMCFLAHLCEKGSFMGPKPCAVWFKATAAREQRIVGISLAPREEKLSREIVSRVSGSFCRPRTHPGHTPLWRPRVSAEEPQEGRVESTNTPQAGPPTESGLRLVLREKHFGALSTPCSASY